MVNINPSVILFQKSLKFFTYERSKTFKYYSIAS